MVRDGKASTRLRSLGAPDSTRLQAAEGWLELGDIQSANDELGAISPELRTHPKVLSMRFAINAKAGRWIAAAEVASALTEMVPDDPNIWMNLSYATRNKPGGGIPEAKIILLAAQARFPNEHLIPLNLACYACQLGAHKEAEQWLKKAFVIAEKTVQRLAVDDHDLQPFWNSVSGISNIEP